MTVALWPLLAYLRGWSLSLPSAAASTGCSPKRKRESLGFFENRAQSCYFAEMLERAEVLGISFVALKVERMEQSAQTVVSHTGAPAGNDAVFEAFFRKYGVLRVQSKAEIPAVPPLFGDWLAQLQADLPLTEADGLSLLQDFGLRAPKMAHMPSTA